MPFSLNIQPKAAQETKKKWKELTYDERIDRLLDVVLNQARIIERLERLQGNILMHRHAKDGRPVIVKDMADGIRGGAEPCNPHDPFLDIDFEP